MTPLKPKTLTVRVTREDIATGVLTSPRYCPVARAFRRLFPKKRVSVSQAHAHAGDRTFALPQKAQAFVQAFDLGVRVRPFSFKVKP